MAGPKFKTVKRVTPGGYEYTVQVVDDTMHATVRDEPTAQRVGTERRAARTDDKRHPATEDKGDEPAAPEKRTQRRTGGRPGAAPRKSTS